MSTLAEVAKAGNLVESKAYGKITRTENPVGKKLYFFENDLPYWARVGKKRTTDEIAVDVSLFGISRNYLKTIWTI
ncbi:hypothetical protein GFS24_20780 [Chitinophaga sp. SYP-B3965]|uniref:hypothetical protein n=1 Tax=Chitinophaga sp. SYP-B3965 TaxID=2663120 RepID=UPI001299A3C2|nr:hypothetical protein [Chitinophaga sp. SYP-B3965]MRG47570.1 hypothetical protein [Chitinophaga sp. SYP-B3965]